MAQILTHSILHTSLAAILTMCSMTTGMVNNYYMSSYHNVGQPQGLVRCNHTLQRHLTSCIHSCASIPACASAFTIRNDTIDSGPQWECMNCENAFHTGEFPPGNGYYTVFKIKTWTFTPNNFIGYDRVHGFLSVLFVCSFDQIFRLVLNQRDQTMPVISDSCWTTICDQAFPSDPFKVTLDDTGFIFTTFCKEGETAYGYDRCDTNGLWKSHGKIGMPCVSSTCFREESQYQRKFYNGGTSVTKGGLECQRWDKQIPHGHTMHDSWFLEDGFSATNAGNKCRDPDVHYYDHQPWCYTMDPTQRMDLCDVPKCEETQNT